MIYIGIDPDVDKSGFAVWEDGNFQTLNNFSFWDVHAMLMTYTIMGNKKNIKIIIEAGWLIKKSNWHTHPNQSKSAGERIAKNVGANHQIGKLLYQYCVENKIEVQLVKPKGKVNSGYFKKLTGWTKRTNQDSRDAAMLVFGL